jgi:S1-C subfamily serine protease
VLQPARAWYAQPRMVEPSPPRHSTRETRLLLLTLAVSVAALLLLARFRFPERPLTDLSTPQPLTRLTRVTAFDELSAMLRDLLRQFEGAVVLARVTPAGGAGAAAGNGIAGGAGSSVNGSAAGGGAAHGRPANGGGTPGGNGSAAGRGIETPRDTLGLLVRDDLALVPVAPGARVDAIAGSPVAANGIVARDEQRGLAVVRVPGYSAAEISVQPPATPLDAPGYVAILEAAPDGPTIRAEFVSRYSTEPHAGWDQPVLALSGPSTAKPGSLLFTLSGRFVGMTLADSGRLLVVPADALMSRATRLANGESIAVVASGIDVQPMTPSIARATGAREGVVVSHVSAGAVSNVIAATGSGNGTGAGAGTGAATEAGAAGSASAGGGSEITIGDVITTAAGRPVRAPRDWQQILREQASGATIKLSILRFGKTLQASLTLPRPVGPTGGSTSSSAGASASGGAGAAGASSTGASGGAAGAAASPQSALDVMGLSLRSVNGGSELIAVRPASPAARAGLRAGDRITSLPGRTSSAAATSPSAIATACAELASGQALLLAIDRDGAARIAAVEKP